MTPPGTAALGHVLDIGLQSLDHLVVGSDAGGKGGVDDPGHGGDDAAEDPTDGEVAASSIRRRGPVRAGAKEVDAGDKGGQAPLRSGALPFGPLFA